MPDPELSRTRLAATGQYEQTPDAPGDSVLDPVAPELPGYQLLNVLGRGGMGVVYRGRDTKLNRPVAVKMVLAGEHADRVTIARFWAEAEVMAAVRHPHVAQVYELGEHAGRPFMAMEYLSGGSLAAWPDGRPLPPRAAAALVEKIARGVQAAHDLGIVHRDLKPANVLLTEDGEPKVTDFGLAKRDTRDDLTRTGAVMGTPAYMSPEQAGGRTKFVGPPADVWALGVILYEALAGRRPFEAADTPELFQRIVSAEPPSVRSAAPRVPRDLANVVGRCLTKEPVGRYPTAGELADDLRRFLDGLPVRARPVGLLGRARRWCRRNPVVTGLLVILAVALGTATERWRAAVAAADGERAARTDETTAKEAAQKAQEEEAKARQQSDRDRDVALRGQAISLRNEALQAAERTDGARALLLLARAIERAEQARDAELSAALRTHFDARRLIIPPLGAVLTTDHPAQCLAVSPDGRFAAVADGLSVDEIVARKLVPSEVAGSARVWDLHAGKPAGPVLPHPAPVKTVAFRPDGLWTLDANGTGRLWDTAAGTARPSPAPRLPLGIDRMFAGPDGRFAVVSGRTVFVVAAGAAELVCPPLEHPTEPTEVAFGPGGTPVAVRCLTGASKAAVHLWDATTGRAVGGPVAVRGLGAMAFHPDGPLLVGGDDGTVRMYDPATAAPLPTVLGSDGPVRSLAVTPGGRFAVGAGGGIRAWALGAKMDNWPHVRGGGLVAHDQWFRHVTFGFSGNVVAAAVNEQYDMRNTGRVHLFDTLTRRPIGAALKVPAPVEQLQFTPDNRAILARLASGAVYAFVWRDPPVAFGPPAAVGTASAVAPDGRAVLVAAGAAARLFDTAGTPLGPPLALPGRARAAAFRPDGRQVAVATADGTLTVWDTATSEPVGPVRRTSAPTVIDELSAPDRVQFGPDGRLVMSTLAGAVWWWPAGAAEPRAVTDGGPRGHPLALSPDGTRLLAATPRGADGFDSTTVRVWELTADGARPVGPVLPGERAVSAAVWRPDGRRVAVARADGTIQVWDAAAGTVAATPRLNGAPLAMAFTADGARLFAAGSDGTARLFDAGTGQPLGPVLPHATPCLSCALSPDGRAAVVGTDGGTVQFWELATGKPLGGPRPGSARVLKVGFSPDGRIACAVGADGRAWPIPAPRPFPGTPAEVMRAAERHTGLALDAHDELVALSPGEWAARRD